MAEFLIGNIKGDSAKITQATATVDETTGTPSVNVTLGGTESERTLNFAFSGLKGEKGDKGDTGSQGDAGVSAINETININDEAPTYTEATTLTTLTSGEKISVAFGKIKKAISSLISHIADTTKHITSAERTSWNAKANASHTHTASELGLGNMNIAVGSYDGEEKYGQSKARVLTFDFTPKLVIIRGESKTVQGADTYPLVLIRGVTKVGYGSTIINNVVWGEKSVSWYNDNSAGAQHDAAGYKYGYVAIG